MTRSRFARTASLYAAFLFIALGAGFAASAGATDFAFVATTDFSTGSSTVIQLPGLAVTQNVASIHSDAIPRWFGGLVYVVNRAGADNIQVLDPANGFATIQQFSTGNGSNPQDIFVLDAHTAYVPRYDTTDLWKVDPTTGAHTGTISLAGLADADGLPEMGYCTLVGPYLFVAVQRLDRNNYYQPVGTSYLAVVDTRADTLVDVDAGTAGAQSIALPAADPFSTVQLDPWTGRLYVACVGTYGVLDGGVVWVDPATFQAQGFALTESAAGGDVLDVEIPSPTRGFAVIATPSFVTNLIMFDPSTGTKLKTLYAPGDYVLQDIETSPSGEVWLADRTPTNPGIRRYDGTTGALLGTTPIDVGLPPFAMAFSVPVQTGAGDTPAPRGVMLEPNVPNPFNPSTVIPFEVSETGRVRLDVVDVAGHVVATLVDGVLAAGAHDARWDGRDAAGRPAASGVYFARLRGPHGGVAVRKLTLVK